MTLTSKLRPSPAMIVACLALAVATTGGAYAVTKLPADSVGTKQLKDNAVKSANIKDSEVQSGDIKNGTIQAGDIKAGVIPTVPDALPGTTVMTARINDIPDTFTQQTTFGAISGITTANTTPGEVTMSSPNVQVKASDLVVNLTVPVNNNSARRFMLMVGGAESGLECTITGIASVCTSSGSATIPPGSTLSWRVDRPAAFNADATEALISFTLSEA